MINPEQDLNEGFLYGTNTATNMQKDLDEYYREQQARAGEGEGEEIKKGGGMAPGAQKIPKEEKDKEKEMKKKKEEEKILKAFDPNNANVQEEKEAKDIKILKKRK